MELADCDADVVRAAAADNPYLHLTAKRILDVTAATALLLLLLPFLTLIAVATKATSPGPVLFTQKGNGVDLRPFEILKFRSMYIIEDDTQVRQAIRGDARITPVGRLLRRTSLDEAPQLANVIKGDMSLVGPRPHALAHDEHFSSTLPLYTARFVARPGLTGLAQVNGARGETPKKEDMQRRVDLDGRYITEASARVDAKILLKTVKEVVYSTTAF